MTSLASLAASGNQSLYMPNPVSMAPVVSSQTSSSSAQNKQVLIVSDRDLTAEEFQTLNSVGTLLSYNDSMVNISISALQFDFFFVKLTDSSRQWLGINLGKTQARVVSISFSKNDPAQWHLDIGSEKIVKALPTVAINMAQYIEALFSQTINKPTPRWLIYALKIWGFFVQVFSAGSQASNAPSA